MITKKMVKATFLYKKAAAYRIKLAVILCIFTAFTIVTAVKSECYITKFFNGSSPLDVLRFSMSTQQLEITSDYTCDEDSPDYGISNNAYTDTSYWEDKTYYFDVPYDDIYPEEIVYTKSVQSNGEAKEVKILSVDIAVINGQRVAVIAYPDTKYYKGKTIKGIFVKAPKIICADIAKKLAPNEVYTMNEYVLDTRGIEMNAESSTLIFLALFILAALYLALKLAAYFVNPLSTPTLRRLKKYGDTYAVLFDIEKQLKSGNITKEKNIIYTEDWVLKKQPFTMRVEKNPAKGGSFKYTP